MTEWSVGLDVDVEPAREDLEDGVLALADKLVDRGISVSFATDGTRYGARFTGYGDTANEAIDEATQLLIDLAIDLGLHGTIIAVEAYTYPELERINAVPVIPELVGVAELAELAGVTRQRASELQKRSPAGFPEPITVLRSGPVWTRPSLDRFLEEWKPRRHAGRPPSLRRAAQDLIASLETTAHHDELTFVQGAIQQIDAQGWDDMDGFTALTKLVNAIDQERKHRPDLPDAALRDLLDAEREAVEALSGHSKAPAG